MYDLLGKKLGSSVAKGVIVDMRQEDRADSNGKVIPKVILTVEDGRKDIFQIDEAWVKGVGHRNVTHGLWWHLDEDGQIRKSSALGQVMVFYHALTLRDLIGHEVRLFPKPNNYLAIIATDSI